ISRRLALSGSGGIRTPTGKDVFYRHAQPAISASDPEAKTRRHRFSGSRTSRTSCPIRGTHRVAAGPTPTRGSSSIRKKEEGGGLDPHAPSGARTVFETGSALRRFTFQMPPRAPESSRKAEDTILTRSCRALRLPNEPHASRVRLPRSFQTIRFKRMVRAAGFAPAVFGPPDRRFCLAKLRPEKKARFHVSGQAGG